MASITNAEIPYIKMTNGGTDPTATPASGYAYLYFKSDGIYIKKSNGSVVGPFLTGSMVTNLNDLSDVTITSADKGHILVRDGTGWINLAPGTDNQVLASDSTTGSGLRWVDADAQTFADLDMIEWLGLI